MLPRRILLSALALVLTTAACSSTRGEPAAPAPAPAPSEPGPESFVIATVDGVPLTLSEAMGGFESSHTGHGALVQGEAAVRELAGRTIERRLFLAEAETLGLREDPAVLAEVEDYRQTVAQGRFWTQEVDEKVTVSDEDVEAFYAKTDVALSVSLIEVADAGLAATLRERVAAGEDFNELAQEHSIDESSLMGGLLSYVRRGELDTALEQPVFELTESGEMTPVIATERGYAFVRLDARTVNADRPDRAVIIPQIRSILKGRAADALREELTGRIHAEAGVVIRDELLTREAMLGDGDADVVVAESAGETMTLGALRDQLNLGAINAATEEQVAEALGGLVDEWAHDLALREHMETTGRLEEPEVEKLAVVFHEDAMLDALYERYVYADVEASEEQIRTYYDENIADQFTRPVKVHLAYIVVPDEEKAVDVMNRLEMGEEFALVAKETSLDPTSAMHGGRIGWIAPGELLPAVEERAFALPAGTIDGPIVTDAGVFVVRVLDRTEAAVVPYVAAKRAATRRLYKELMREAYDEWARILRDRADIQLQDRGIRQAAAWFDRQGAPPEAPESPAGHGNAPPGGMGGHGR